MATPVRHVILPWTQPVMVADTSQLPAVLDLQKDLIVKVGESSKSAALGDNTTAIQEKNPSESPLQNPWHALVQLGPPDIPETHRMLLDEESLVGASIVLDVLTSRSPSIQEEETILSDVAQLLMDTVQSIQGNHDDLETLADVLSEPEGNLRQSIGERLQERAISNNAQAIPEPVSVANAIRAIEALSDVAIREVTLIIDGQPLIETKHI